MKKISYLVVIVILLISHAGVHAQAPDWSWSAGTSNASAAAITATAGGKAYVATNLGTNPGAGTISLTSYDAAGNVLWTKQTGGSVSTYSVTAIAADRLGNFYIAGDFMSSNIPQTMDFDGTILTATYAVTGCGFLVKYDSTGHLIWAKTIQSTSIAEISSISTDTSGNVCMTGRFYSAVIFGGITINNDFISSGYECFIAKYNSSGAVAWANLISGSGDLTSTGIASDGAGNFFITGNFIGAVTFTGVFLNISNSYYSVFVAKYNSAGTTLWATHAGGTTAYDSSGHIASDASGNVYMTGAFSSSTITFGTTVLSNSGITDIFLTKYNSSGAVQWAKKIGGTGAERGIAVTTDAIGNLYLAGNYSSPSLTLDAISLPGTGADFFIAKYNTSGTLQWAKNNTAEVIDIAVNNCSDIYAVGNINTLLTLSPTPVLNGSAFTGKVGDVLGSVVNTGCPGSSNGSVVVTALDPGIPPYTYLWANGDTMSSLTGLSIGTYTVTVADARGCVNNELVTVTNRSDIAATFTTSNVNCSGPCTGAVTASPSNGVPPYSYLWDPSTGGQTTAIASSLCPAALYSVVVTDSLGCTKNFSVRLNATTTITSQVSVSNITSVDRVTLDPAFSAYYAYDVPPTIATNSSNPDNFVNPGQPVRLKVKCLNQKTNATSISSGQCIARTNSPYATISDSMASFSSIANGSSQWSDDEIEIDINSATPAGTNVYLDVIVLDNTNQYKNTCIAIPVMPFVMARQNDTTITDNNTGNSHGNGNSICENGETIEFKPLLNSVTNLRAYYTRSTLQNLDNLSYINIWNNHSGVNGNVMDTSWWSLTSMINPGSANVFSRSDFVFDYNNTTTINDFLMYNIFTSGFRLFPSSFSPISPFRWTAPFDFNNTSLVVKSTVSPGHEINIYPNPSKGSFTISLSQQTKNCIITVIDMSGKTIFRSSYTTNIIHLDLVVPDGVYFVCINDETNRERVIKKIVILK